MVPLRGSRHPFIDRIGSPHAWAAAVLLDLGRVQQRDADLSGELFGDPSAAVAVHDAADTERRGPSDVTTT
jgi:hypothetical protein